MGRRKLDQPSERTAYMRSWLETEAGQAYREQRKDYLRQWKLDNPEKFARSKNNSYNAIRRECFARYSGDEQPSCRCCGEDTLEFLHLDHIDGDGADFRRNHPTFAGRKVVGGTALYYWLKAEGWPDLRLQVLCANCNLSKRAGKYCIHELKRGIDMNGNSIPEDEQLPLGRIMAPPVMTRKPSKPELYTHTEPIILRQEFCKRGHPLDGDNVRLYRGRRCCRACERERTQALAIAAGRVLPSARTTCKNGHPKSPDNLYTYPSGQKQCIACRRSYKQQRTSSSTPA